jgi:hypothetical protein
LTFLEKEAMLKIYLGSPYTHSDPSIMEDRYLAACLKTSQLAKEGYYVYSPIVHWHPIASIYELPKDWKFWKKMDRISISLMDEVWILKLEGWSISEGLGNEILLAKELNKPYVFIDP